MGIGTVSLPVQRTPTLTGEDAKDHGTLELTNVLHIPDAPYNQIGLSLIWEENYHIGLAFTNGRHMTITNDQNERLAYLFKDERYVYIKLSSVPIGPPVAYPELRPHIDHVKSSLWPRVQRQRWRKVHKTAVQKGDLPAPPPASEDVDEVKLATTRIGPVEFILGIFGHEASWADARRRRFWRRLQHEQ